MPDAWLKRDLLPGRNVAGLMNNKLLDYETDEEDETTGKAYKHTI